MVVLCTAYRISPPIPALWMECESSSYFPCTSTCCDCPVASSSAFSDKIVECRGFAFPGRGRDSVIVFVIVQWQQLIMKIKLMFLERKEVVGAVRDALELVELNHKELHSSKTHRGFKGTDKKEALVLTSQLCCLRVRSNIEKVVGFAFPRIGIQQLVVKVMVSIRTDFHFWFDAVGLELKDVRKELVAAFHSNTQNTPFTGSHVDGFLFRLTGK